MSSCLIIHIVGNEGKLTWFLQGEEATIANSSAETLQKKNWGDFKGEVIVFVPTQDVYLTQAKLPQLSSAKLRKMVPFAIEDEISDEISDCHFAIATPDSTGNTPIAVVSRERMDVWLQLIPQALREHISVMTPDVLALPCFVNSWTLAETNGQALVRMADLAGFAIEKDNVVEIVNQYMRDNSHKAESILLISPNPDTGLEKLLSSQLHLPVTLNIQQNPWPVFLYKNFEKNRALNLIQGEYQSSYSTRGISRLQKIFSVMTVTWLLLLCAFGVIKLALLNYQAHNLDAELAVTYNDIFPGEAANLSPKQRIETALATVKKAKQQSVFLRLVATASPVLVNTKGVSVQSATFNNAQLDVQLETTDFQLLDKVTADLRAKGLVAEQSHAAKAGDVIQSHLLIKEIR